MKLYTVNGAPGTGKTTFEKMVKEELGGGVFLISTIDYVKDVAHFCGWNGEKTPNDRWFLSQLKELLKIWKDIPYKKVQEKLQLTHMMYPNAVVFIDSREPEELERYRKDGATSIIIRRRDVQVEISNSSDRNVDKFDYDIEIWNEGTLDDLREAVREFIEAEGLK